MILQLKVYLITALYSFGIFFMILYPPRNYEQSGTKMRKVRSAGNRIKYLEYLDYDTVLGIVTHMAAEDSEMAEVIHLSPNTFSNKSIIALKLHSDTHSKKPGILVIATLNGMAWGGPNAVIELAEKLLYDTNYQTPFFNDYDWYLIPIANPDALNFTTNSRNLTPVNNSEWSRNLTARSGTRPSLWHKNVEQTTEDNLCFGTNINRNFAYHWQDDVPKRPASCSQYYPGSKPFSTAEAKALQAYLHNLSDVIHLAVHLHASFVPKKEFIVYPWRYTLRQPSNFRTLQDIGEYAARQARLPDGRLYEVHQGSSDGRVAGSLSDYISGVVGIELVFLIKPYHEVFPNYTDSFLLVSPYHQLACNCFAEGYVKKSISAILSLVRGWRSNTKQNTLSFFGEDIEF